MRYRGCTGEADQADRQDGHRDYNFHETESLLSRHDRRALPYAEIVMVPVALPLTIRTAALLMRPMPRAS
jgi:hypothetical protein